MRAAHAALGGKAFALRRPFAGGKAFARFGGACLKGLSGEQCVWECSYVASNVTELEFFSTKVRLGPNGAEEVLPIGEITDFEQKGLAECKEILQGTIEKGKKFVTG